MYERVIYLDADEIVLSNIEHLFVTVNVSTGTVAQVAAQGFEYVDFAVSSGRDF